MTHLFKNTAIALALMLFSPNLWAVPAKPFKRTVTQPDGSTLTLLLLGDETQHYFATADSLPVIEQAGGSIFYATLSMGRICASPFLAHDAGQRSRQELSFIQQTSRTLQEHLGQRRNQKLALRNQHRLAHIPTKRQTPSNTTYSFSQTKYTGKKRGLVILVNFADKKFVNSREDVHNQFNEEGYNKNKHIGSVRDYFLKQSYGQLTIDFDVVGPYELSQDMQYYGEDVDEVGEDAHPDDMIVDACAMADKEVNFADYDWDGDGEVDQVYVIYAGYGQAQGASSFTIWPHEWNLVEARGTKIELDGVLINTYACSNELYGVTGSRLDGIGTACHEFTHCLGIPDFYDTAHSGNFGLNTWSIMDYGTYNGPSNYSGSVPAGFTAFERWCAGWLHPVELSSGRNIRNMPALMDEPIAYVIYNEGHRNEFYMLENRQQIFWDGYLGGHGMLVTHVDYDPFVWAYNEVNTTQPNISFSGNNHQCYSIVAADNLYTKASLSADPFPGGSKNYDFTDTSTPRASLYHANIDGRRYLGKPIQAISENSEGLISFKFNGGFILLPPTLYEPEEAAVGKHGFIATWSPVENVESYTLKLTEITDADVSASLLLSEDFSGFANITYNAGRVWDNSLDDVLSSPGWTGSKLYHGNTHGIKLGSASYSGSITTPLLPAPGNGEGIVTAYFGAEPYNASESPAFFVVKCTGESGTTYNEESVTVQGGQYLTHFSNVNEPFKVTFATDESQTKRAYINFIQIYGADVSEEEIVHNNVKATSSLHRAVTQTISGVKSNQFYFSALNSSVHVLQVKAFANGEESDWSDKLLIDLSQAVNEVPTLAVPTEKKAARSVWEVENIDITLDDPKSILNPFTTDSDGTITFTSSDESIATVDAQGIIRIVGTGQVTITATTTSTLTYESSTTTLSIYVFHGDGSREHPYDVSDALHLHHTDQTTTDHVWVTGYLTNFTEGGVLFLSATQQREEDDDSPLVVADLTGHPQLEEMQAYLADKTTAALLVNATIDDVFGACVLRSVDDILLGDISVGIQYPSQPYSLRNRQNPVYDLTGRRVSHTAPLPRGIYISQHKKIIIQ